MSHVIDKVAYIWCSCQAILPFCMHLDGTSGWLCMQAGWKRDLACKCFPMFICCKLAEQQVGRFPNKTHIRDQTQIFWLRPACPAGQQHSYSAQPMRGLGAIFHQAARSVQIAMPASAIC